MGNCSNNECWNECLSVLVVLLPFCLSVPGTLPLFHVIKWLLGVCWIVKCINTAREKRRGRGRGRVWVGGWVAESVGWRVRGEAGEWVLNPTGWDFKGSLLNQICSYPITDCSLHLDKRWRKGWARGGADSGMRMREEAGGWSGRGRRESCENWRRRDWGLWTWVWPVTCSSLVTHHIVEVLAQLTEQNHNFRLRLQRRQLLFIWL